MGVQRPPAGAEVPWSWDVRGRHTALAAPGPGWRRELGVDEAQPSRSGPRAGRRSPRDASTPECLFAVCTIVARSVKGMYAGVHLPWYWQ